MKTMNYIAAFILILILFSSSFARGNAHTEPSKPIASVALLQDTIKDVYLKVDKEAEFRGGTSAWARHLGQVLTQYMSQFDEDDYGTIEMQFIVDKKGKASNIKALNKEKSVLAQVAAIAITRAPRWIPALVNGEKVASFKTLKVTLNKPR